jgi:hypothetical protein
MFGIKMTISKNHALFIFTKKTPWMQRISDLVRTGHHHYIQGQIPLDKAKFLAKKFSDLYETGLSKLDQSRKRKNGFASFRFLAWFDEHNNIVHWILCRTEGQTPDSAKREKWQDATSKNRIHISGGYELVRLTKPAEPKPVWTWRYTKSHYEGFRESILRIIRTKHDEQLKELIHEIWRTPGFAGARDQVKSIAKLIISEWKRSRNGLPLPEIPKRIGYVRRIPDVGYILK